MKPLSFGPASAGILLAAAIAVPGLAQTAPEFPAPRDGQAILKDFKFHTGEVMPELKVAYKTIGDPSKPAILVLHGTAGSSASMLARGFAGAMYGAGQPLDATKYFLILPDALGAGKTAKPSDGLKARFPKYNYDDMVDAQYRLVTEGLGIRHLRLVIGNSMGGMHAWVWAVRYPDAMDGIVPMASQPTAMASRNWMMRRLMIETIKADPDYKDGDYTTQPKLARLANVVYATGTNGGDLAYQKLAPTRAAADKMIDDRLAAPFNADANDFIWQWQSSADYNPEPNLGKIKARVLAINSADDERNPLDTGLMAGAIKAIPNARLFVIPASAETRGHGTTGGFAGMYAKEVGQLLAEMPARR